MFDNSTTSAVSLLSMATRKRPTDSLGLFALRIAARRAPGLRPATDARSICIKSMGHVAEIFPHPPCSKSSRELAIGIHATPLPAIPSCSMPSRSRWPATRSHRVAHNGNHQRTPPSCAPSRARGLDLPGVQRHRSDPSPGRRSARADAGRRAAEAMLQLEGAFSLVFLASDRIIVARDPNGFRPLAMGQLEMPGDKLATPRVRDLRIRPDRAVYLNDVDRGEMVIAGPEGITRER